MVKKVSQVLRVRAVKPAKGDTCCQESPGSPGEINPACNKSIQLDIQIHNGDGKWGKHPLTDLEGLVIQEAGMGKEGELLLGLVGSEEKKEGIAFFEKGTAKSTPAPGVHHIEEDRSGGQS